MGKQVNYIINAALILILIMVSIWAIQKLTFEKSNSPDQTVIISKNQSIVLSKSVAKGKSLFMSKCASCHAIFKDMTGPGIEGFLERGPWVDRKNVYEWIRNPSAFMEKNEYVRELKKRYNSMMTAFPDLTNEEIDAICDYIYEAKKVDYSIPVAER